jgi:hypothetical protein
VRLALVVHTEYMGTFSRTFYSKLPCNMSNDLGEIGSVNLNHLISL